MASDPWGPPTPQLPEPASAPPPPATDQASSLASDESPTPAAAAFSFDGGAATFWGTALLGLLITVVTLGICYPFALVLLERWRAKHTFVEGRQLQFTGRAWGLFGRWVLWLFLIVITLGIYSFWVVPRLTRWRVEQRTRLPEGYPGRFRFDGGAASYWGTALLGLVITVVTLGICYPFALVLLQRWRSKHTYIDGRQLEFIGSAWGLFGRWIVWLLLIVVTLGIYSFWVIPRVTKWKVEHQRFQW